MQLDNNFYFKMINVFIEKMSLAFGEDVSLLDQKITTEQMGTFKLVFRYYPNDYKIVIENELRHFFIEIVDNDNASNFLNRISQYENNLTEKEIENAVKQLKTVLENNDFCLYFNVNDKLYKKYPDGKTKRVSDLQELIRVKRVSM